MNRNLFGPICPRPSSLYAYIYIYIYINVSPLHVSRRFRARKATFANEIFSSTPIKHLTVLTILTAALRILLSTGPRLMTHRAEEGEGEPPPRQIKTAMVKLTVPSAR